VNAHPAPLCRTRRRAVAQSGLDTSRCEEPNTRPNGRHSGLEATLSNINWAVELRKIEREFDGLPPEPTPEELRRQRDAQRREREEEDARTGASGVYFRMILVVSLGVAIAFWPYEVACGASLFGYLTALITLILGGVWAALGTWRYHMARSHALTLFIILWALGLVAVQILPRVGYARPDPARSTAWSCE
jgi:hypothetical protein